MTNKTLKQLIIQQFKDDSETGAKMGLDDKYINAFRLWLLQKPLGVRPCRKVVEFRDELLEELK